MCGQKTRMAPSAKPTQWTMYRRQPDWRVWPFICSTVGTNWKVDYALTLETVRLAQIFILWVESYKLLLANVDINASGTSSTGDASPLSLSEVGSESEDTETLLEDWVILDCRQTTPCKYSIAMEYTEVPLFARI